MLYYQMDNKQVVQEMAFGEYDNHEKVYKPYMTVQQHTSVVSVLLARRDSLTTM